MKQIIQLTILLLVLAASAYAQPSGETRHLNIRENKIALEGFDPVAYFHTGKAIKGKAAITAQSEGITYHFSSAANRDHFVASPSSFKPQYGGWCAYAMGAKGEKVEVDPETFKIVEGKLYLFYNRFFNNTLDSWNDDEARLKADADKNWSKLIRK
ncbi:MAG TPA: YHS domain-containing (seleno)protein [Chryseosolibacter sp.]